MSEHESNELAGDYYVHHFFQLTDFVVKTYHDLLTQAELDWCTALHTASADAQRLYIRLLSRRGSVYRLSCLRYIEISNIPSARSELVHRGLAHCDTPQQLSALLSSFTKPQILEILDLQDRRTMSRVDLVDYIEQVDAATRAQYRQRLQGADRWITIQGYANWTLFQLCFFGNLYQDSSALTLDQLGTVKYADYSIDRASRVFTSRSQVEAHWRYFECETLYECCRKTDKDALLALARKLPDNIAGDATLQRRLDRIRNRIARQLERLSCHAAAQQLYQQSVHPPARERRARILIAQKAWQEAISLAEQMSEKPRNEAERLTARRLLAQCHKVQGLNFERPPTFKPVVSKLVLHNTGGRVEELARRYYARHGSCYYVENALVTGVLGLFIWDIIFYALPGVFFNRFQVAPADFYSPEFQIRRHELIEQRFTEIADRQRFHERILSTFKSQYGNVNPLVNWLRLSPELLSLAVERIGKSQWLALFRRVLADPREHRTGLPDLVFFSHNGGYEFIEIKGPGDALQTHQRRWMQYFREHNVDYRLVHVGFRVSEPLSTSVNKLTVNPTDDSGR